MSDPLAAGRFSENPRISLRGSPLVLLFGELSPLLPLITRSPKKTVFTVTAVPSASLRQGPSARSTVASTATPRPHRWHPVTWPREHPPLVSEVPRPHLPGSHGSGAACADPGTRWDERAERVPVSHGLSEQSSALWLHACCLDQHQTGREVTEARREGGEPLASSPGSSLSRGHGAALGAATLTAPREGRSLRL